MPMEIFKKERVLETTKSLDDIIKSFTILTPQFLRV